MITELRNILLNGLKQVDIESLFKALIDKTKCSNLQNEDFTKTNTFVLFKAENVSSDLDTLNKLLKSQAVFISGPTFKEEVLKYGGVKDSLLFWEKLLDKYVAPAYCLRYVGEDGFLYSYSDYTSNSSAFILLSLLEVLGKHNLLNGIFPHLTRRLCSIARMLEYVQDPDKRKAESDKTETDIDKALDKLDTDAETKWFTNHGFFPFKIYGTDNTQWVRYFSVSDIKVYHYSDNKYQAKVFWYSERGARAKRSKVCNTYEEALREVLPEINTLVERENKRMAKNK